MGARYIVGDVFDVLATLEPGSVDLVMTSPPFLALRSYLPSDHESKHLELGSEATPGEFIDRMLDVVEACARVLAPHGSLVFELGDTYAGSGGAGGDYNEGGLREFQPAFDGSAARSIDVHDAKYRGRDNKTTGAGGAWPLAKSKVLIPQLFAIALAYGFNPLTGRQTDPWRVRNTVAWCRPNPPVGRDGDKFRPATSFLTVACKARDRYWDGDAVRTEHTAPNAGPYRGRMTSAVPGGDSRPVEAGVRGDLNSAGAPLLDWWEIPTAPPIGARTVHRVRVPSDALCDGIQRTTSPDCPVHGSPDHRDSSAPDGEHGAGDPSHNGRSDGRPDPAPLAETPPTSSTSAPTASSGSLFDPVATLHSKPSSRTGHAPATTPVDTPSAQTPGGIARTSDAPESSEPGASTYASSTEPVGSPARSLSETDVRTVGTSAQPVGSACRCSHFVDISIAQDTTDYAAIPPESLDWWEIPTHGFKGSHYATYPPDLVVPVVKSMCPSRVCQVCGKPSIRITGEVEYVGDGKLSDAWRHGRFGDAPESGDRRSTSGTLSRAAETLGWSDCGHNDWRAGVVLDPFAGSGTTLAVATGHGLDAIGCDLDERNADLARERIGGLLMSVEHFEALA